MASSLDLTVLRGSPTAVSTPSFGVDPATHEVKRWTLPPKNDGANLQHRGHRRQGPHLVHRAKRHFGSARSKKRRYESLGRAARNGPLRNTATPDGQIWYVSLAGSYLGRPDLETGEVTVIDPPKKASGTRRISSDSDGRLWVSEWNAGTISVYDPQQKSWRTWALPGEREQTYKTAIAKAGISTVNATQGLRLMLIETSR